jgi:predicted N-formylglutamate amidohydrolase
MNMELQLGSHEPAPVEIVRRTGTSSLLIHCDHGGNQVPQSLRHLGLTSAELDRHIGWDIGAAAVARALAQNLRATAVMCVYSRLVIDCNRAFGDIGAIPGTSDGIPVPANMSLSAQQRAARADAFYWPYHRAIDIEVARIQADGRVPVMLSVHSFTPALMTKDQAMPRPWHCGVMFSRDTRFGDHLISALRGVTGMNVGVNEPYSGITHGYCMKAHGLAQGLPHAQIEIRQDLICTPAGQRWWAGLLSCLIEPILGQPDLATIRHY